MNVGEAKPGIGGDTRSDQIFPPSYSRIPRGQGTDLPAWVAFDRYVAHNMYLSFKMPRFGAYSVPIPPVSEMVHNMIQNLHIIRSDRQINILLIQCLINYCLVENSFRTFFKKMISYTFVFVVSNYLIVNY